MVDNKDTNRLIEKRDFIHIIILLLIALGIGVYLIATSVLIAKDGVYYIERAQKFSSDPSGVIKSHPPGYPCLIFIVHKFAALFSNSSSVFSWIYTAQSVTLLCRLLGLAALYFVGKLFVGSNKSFWSILILVMLPYPARFGSDVLRDWPYLMFLSLGFLFLILGARERKTWMFGITGFAAGIGHIIRPECAQLIIYASLWQLSRFLRPKEEADRRKAVYAFAICLICFAIPTAPYVKVREKLLPDKLEDLVSPTVSQEQGQNQEPDDGDCCEVYIAKSFPRNINNALIRLAGELCDNLMYFFALPLAIGVFYRLRKKTNATEIERFFILSFIVLNAIMMIFLYYHYQYISRRHSLPLAVFLIFYVVIGLEVLGNWLGSRNAQSCSEANQNSRRWFFILVAVGVAIGLPKLVRPLRIEKRGYRDAAKWLRENTAQEDLIAVPDSRIGFYAERNRIVYIDNEVAPEVKYIIRIEKSENQISGSDNVLRKEYSSWVDMKKKEKKLVIYRVM